MTKSPYIYDSGRKTFVARPAGAGGPQDIPVIPTAYGKAKGTGAKGEGTKTWFWCLVAGMLLVWAALLGVWMIQASARLKENLPPNVPWQQEGKADAGKIK